MSIPRMSRVVFSTRFTTPPHVPWDCRHTKYVTRHRRKPNRNSDSPSDYDPRHPNPCGDHCCAPRRLRRLSSIFCNFVDWRIVFRGMLNYYQCFLLDFGLAQIAPPNFCSCFFPQPARFSPAPSGITDLHRTPHRHFYEEDMLVREEVEL